MPEPHTLRFIDTDMRVVSTFDMGTGKLDGLRSAAKSCRLRADSDNGDWLKNLPISRHNARLTAGRSHHFGILTRRPEPRQRRADASVTSELSEEDWLSMGSSFEQGAIRDLK
jgi:hypothetical protein